MHIDAPHRTSNGTAWNSRQIAYRLPKHSREIAETQMGSLRREATNPPVG